MISKAVDLFNTRYQKTKSCWNWIGSITKNGYGIVTVGGRRENGGKTYYAHRLAYELFKVKIPLGLEIDHLCRNRKCVNPNHLETVTRSENTKRGIGPMLLARINGSKKFCKHNHPFDKVNTRYRKKGGRACKTCDKVYSQNYRLAKRRATTVVD